MTEESDKLDFLDGTEEAPEVQVGAPAEVAEPTGEQEAAPPVAAEEKPQTIPITALLDEREKRQEAMRRAEEAERRLSDIERRIAAAQQQRKPPDFFEKPEEAVRQFVAPIAQQVQAVKLQQSRFLAEKEFGEDLVKEAYAYFDENPQESHRLLEHPSPFHAAVEHYKRQKFMREVGNDPEAWLAKQRETWAQEASPPSPAPVNRPPISLAAAPAAGRGNPQAKGNAFDQAFPV